MRRGARYFEGGTTFPWINGAAPFAVAPLAAGDGGANFDPVFLICGMAVLSAGLVVLHAAHSLRPQFAPVAATTNGSRKYTAEEALAERGRLAGETDVLVDALAAAAATFYAIAGRLPSEDSARALARADDLRELVWINRGG